jgi:hypothetical protein
MDPLYRLILLAQSENGGSRSSVQAAKPVIDQVTIVSTIDSSGPPELTQFKDLKYRTHPGHISMVCTSSEVQNDAGSSPLSAPLTSTELESAI